MTAEHGSGTWQRNSVKNVTTMKLSEVVVLRALICYFDI